MRVPFDKLYVLVVSRQDTTAGVLHYIPILLLKNPNGFITGARGDVGASRTPRDTLYFILLAFEGLIGFEVQLASLTLFLEPEASCSIKRRASEH